MAVVATLTGCSIRFIYKLHLMQKKCIYISQMLLEIQKFRTSGTDNGVSMWNKKKYRFWGSGIRYPSQLTSKSRIIFINRVLLTRCVGKYRSAVTVQRINLKNLVHIFLILGMLRLKWQNVMVIFACLILAQIMYIHILSMYTFIVLVDPISYQRPEKRMLLLT